MLTEIEITTAVINRLKAVLPAKFAPSVISYPDKPEQMTGDVIRNAHPHGLYIVHHTESEGAGGMEVVTITVFVVGITQARDSLLARAAKLAINGYQVAGGTRFQFSKDEVIDQEGGISMRGISFQTNIPACQVAEARLTAAIAALNL